MAIRVLLIERDRSLCELLADSLARLGYDVARACCAAEAMERLGQGTFGIVVVDLDLHGMSASRFCRIARTSWPSLRIVVLTELGDTPAAARALRSGADDFVSKPIDLDILEHVLARARRDRQADAEVESRERRSQSGPKSDASSGAAPGSGRRSIWRALCELFGISGGASRSASEGRASDVGGGERPSRRHVVGLVARGASDRSSALAAGESDAVPASAIRRAGTLSGLRFTDLASSKAAGADDWFEGCAEGQAGTERGAWTSSRIPKLSGKHPRR